ncbi:MAG: carbohydrate kinase family protein [Candidatus Levyibacteriota bacterium]
MSSVAVTTIGDAVIDCFLHINNPSQFCKFNSETHELVLESGSKILVDDASFLLGGNASNVAVGLTRLGFATALCAELGDDEFKEKIIKALTHEQVGQTLLVETKGAQSTFSVVIDIKGERTLFVHHVVREHELPVKDIQSEWIYLTSLGEKWETLYKDVLSHAKKQNSRIAFNPGSTQLKRGRESFIDVLPQTEILFVNREEGEEILYGKILMQDKKEDPKHMLFQLQHLGAKIIVMTDGGNGAYAMDEKGNYYKQKVIPVTIVEKTGAGDAFSTGFLGAILSGKSLEEALQWGAQESASVMQFVGAQHGLLQKHVLEERIRTL